MAEPDLVRHPAGISFDRRARRAPPDPAGTGRDWLVEPRRPQWVKDRPNAHYYVLAAVCVGAFMGQLDASIVTVAFPTLRRTFDASLGAVTWVGLSYLIVLVAGVTAVGRLADMVGRKLLYTYGFLVFILGSGLCALAPTLLSLDLFRMVQGVGAAMLQANSVAIIYLALPRDRLGRGIGIQGAAQALGLALGPVVGGFLLVAGGWRLIFFVNIPAGIVGVAAAWIFVPRSRELQDRVPYDWKGLALFVPTVAASLVVISFGNSWGWQSPLVVFLVVFAVASGVVFVLQEGRTDHPMLDPALFRRSSFSIGLSTGLLSYLLLFGTLFAVPFFLEIARGMSAAEAGLTLTLFPFALGCTAPVAGRIGERVGSRPLTGTGMVLCAVGLAYLGVAQPSRVGLVLGLAVVGVGLGLFTPPNNAAVMASAPREQAGLASGILNMTRGLGTALGLALTSLVLGAGSHHLLSAGAVSDGFEAACLFLSGVALLAAVLAVSRRDGDLPGRRPPRRPPGDLPARHSPGGRHPWTDSVPRTERRDSTMAQPVRPDTSEMAAVHKVFRSSLASAPEFIASAKGDEARRALIANYYANVMSFLEVHHDGEEELLFPLLVERAPEHRGRLDEALAQHKQALAALKSSRDVLTAWEDKGDSEAESLERSLRALDEVLSAHLDMEEAEIVPLAADHVTVEEWGMLPAHAFADFKGDKIWLILGLIRENFTDEQRAIMLAHMPPPAVQMWETMGETSFNRMMAEVRETG